MDIWKSTDNVSWSNSYSHAISLYILHNAQLCNLHFGSVRQYFLKTITKMFAVHWKHTHVWYNYPIGSFVQPFFIRQICKKMFIDIKFHGSHFKVNQGSLTGTERLKCVDAGENVPENRRVKCPSVLGANLTGVWISLPSSVCCRCAQNSDGRKSIGWVKVMKENTLARALNRTLPHVWQQISFQTSQGIEMQHIPEWHSRSCPGSLQCSRPGTDQMQQASPWNSVRYIRLIDRLA